MHIKATLEKNKIHKDLPNVIVICHGGMATSNYLSTQLNYHFKLNIIATCSVHNAQNIIKKQAVDLIISTIPIHHFDIPTIVVDALLTEKDINRLHKKLSLINENHTYEAPPLNNTNSRNSLQSLLSPNRIALDKEAFDWKDAIISAGELLLWDKFISVNYLHKMIDLVIKYGPYIVIAPHVALAHASPDDGAIGTGVSIVRLKEPIAFGKEKLDPVKIVLACSFLDTPENANTLLNLMRTVQKPSFLSMALKIEDPKDLLDYFQ